MANVKTLFAYIFGLASLMIALGIVSQAKLVEVERLPSPTPSATPSPKPLPFPGAARLASCRDLSQPRFYFYIPALKDGAEKPLNSPDEDQAANPHPSSLHRGARSHRP